MVTNEFLKKAEDLSKWYLVLEKLGSIYGFNMHDELKEVYNTIKHPIMPMYNNQCSDCIYSALLNVHQWYLKNKPVDEPAVEAVVDAADMPVAIVKRGRKPKA
jgi:hypothetical protein